VESDEAEQVEFQIKLADKKIKIESLYREVYQMCSAYLCEEEEADIEIHSSRELIEEENGENREGNAVTDAYRETLAVYRQIAEEMLAYDTFLMHGSVVAKGGRAFMFTAASGVGKTTRTRLWLDQIADSQVINGDKPLIRITDQEVIACGSPWSGKEKLNNNLCLPLAAVYFLERGEETSLRRLSFSEVFVRLLRQTYRPKEAGKMAKTLELLKKMENKTAFYLYRNNLKDMDMKWLYEETMKGVQSFLF
jgi:hypothetical protein